MGSFCSPLRSPNDIASPVIGYYHNTIFPLILSGRKHLFSRDRKSFRNLVILWDGVKADRPAEKDLGRNLSSIGSKRSKPTEDLTSGNYEGYPKHSQQPAILNPSKVDLSPSTKFILPSRNQGCFHQDSILTKHWKAY